MALDQGRPPFWPWIEVLRAHADRRGEAHDPAAVDLAELVFAPDTPAPRDPSQARVRLYQAVAARLLAADGTGPSLVVLEDLHGADESSLHLLRFVARQLAAAHCLLVVTHRPVEPASELAVALGEAARTVDVERVVLPPLSDTEVAAYLEQSLGRDLAPEAVATTIRAVEGHAFFLTEIVRLLRTRLRSGQPVAGADSLAEIPRSVSEMIGRRFAALGDDALRVLFAASVVGREFDVRMLARVVGLDLDTVLDRVEEAADAGLVQDLPGGRLGYRFDHALTQQTLYAQLPGPRRVMLHVRVGDALDVGAADAAGDQLAELAHHRCSSVAETGLPAAMAVAVAAADAAMSQLAFEEAARLYELALNTHEQHSDDPRPTGPLLVAVGHARSRSGHPKAARASFLRAAQLARSRGDADQLAAAALGLGGAFETLGFDPDLVGLLEEALAVLPPARTAVRARLMARLSAALNLSEAAERRHELSRLALATARELGDRPLEAACLSAHFFALWGPDLESERLECAAETLRLAEELGDQELTLQGLAWTICELFESADRRALEARLPQHARLAEATRDPLHNYFAAMWRATLAAVDGRALEAVELAAQAAALGEPLTALASPRRTALTLVALRDLGRLSELVGDVDMAAANFPFFPSWTVARAWVHLQLGDPEPGERLLGALPQDVGTLLPRDGNWVNGMAMIAEVVAGIGDADRARELRRLLQPYSGRMSIVRFAVSWMGPMDRTLALLASCCGDWAAADVHYREAIGIAQSFGARPYRAYTECDYAGMLLRRGRVADEPEARRLIASASETAQELELAGLSAVCAQLPPPLRRRTA